MITFLSFIFILCLIFEGFAFLFIGYWGLLLDYKYYPNYYNLPKWVREKFDPWKGILHR